MLPITYITYLSPMLDYEVHGVGDPQPEVEYLAIPYHARAAQTQDHVLHLPLAPIRRTSQP